MKWIPASFLKSSQTAAIPMAPKTRPAPVWPFWPALTISDAATLSGKGRSASTTSARRRMITKSTPRTPPMSMIKVASRRLNFVQAPLIMKAGMVKIAPATRDSPTEAVVRAMFSSRILPLKTRRAAMATTAAGNVAATVRPTFIPR